MIVLIELIAIFGIIINFLGPDAWHIDFPVAKKGHRQSPIDIQTDVEETDEGLKENPLTWKYCPEKVLHIENTGFSWTVSVSGAESCKYPNFFP